jgi:hypothetical protein
MDEIKTKMQQTVSKLREAGIDLKETPAFFKWYYDEDPAVKYELLISELTEKEVIQEMKDDGFVTETVQ